MKSRNYALMAFLSILVPVATAWNVAFYDNTAYSCGDSNDDFSYSVYSGSGQGDCLAAGNPGDSCQWWTDSGLGFAQPCTMPMSPPPGSISLQEGTNCILSWTSDCLGSEMFGASGICSAPPAPDGGSDGTLYFKCSDA